MYVKLGALALILGVPLASVVPPELAFENGVIENFQVALLISIALANLRWAKISADNAPLRWFHIFCAMLMIVFALRELSWGRVFFQTGVAPNGEPYFVMMSNYPYRVPVYIFLTLWISAMLGVLFRFLPVKRFLLERKPLGALAVMFAAVILAQAGDHDLIAHGEILEELEELVAYAMLPEICLFYREFLS